MESCTIRTTLAVYTKTLRVLEGEVAKLPVEDQKPAKFYRDSVRHELGRVIGLLEMAIADLKYYENAFEKGVENA